MLLELAVQPGLAPAASLACDRGALAARRPLLRVYELADDVLSLGRYHRAPRGGGVHLLRRHTGGRAVPCGPGFAVVALVLPHRAALVADRADGLAPEQVMNRTVRGVLRALELAGLPAFYPGRDLITVARRILGLVSMEVDAAGTLLFEAIVANGGDLARLPALLDAADPDGLVTAEPWSTADVTSIARERGAPLPLDELAALLRRGFAEKFGVEWSAAAPPALPVDEAAWLASRRPRPELDRRGTSRTQLGGLEAHFALAGDRLAAIELAGEFIADSPGIAALEAGLRGCAAERAAVDAVVSDVLGSGEHFVLGIGPRATIAETVMKGVGR